MLGANTYCFFKTVGLNFNDSETGFKTRDLTLISPSDQIIFQFYYLKNFINRINYESIVRNPESALALVYCRSYNWPYGSGLIAVRQQTFWYIGQSAPLLCRLCAG